ncbi:immunity 53 family protein [Saprospira grandis]|uniref:immunity 53 family protein n=1 Tax=Saprospira grandis TaxID=1008 RepID=UPI0022DCFFD8|nr:immunity 53 family protein [Saprospira grandis]WBM74409.1 immunity 53 family protein [Saprospira grandis]
MNSLDVLEEWALLYSAKKEQVKDLIHICNIDNPGWGVKIDLKETILDGASVEWERIEGSKDGWSTGDWHGIAVVDAVFDGFGGPRKLRLLLNRFKDLVEQKKKELGWNSPEDGKKWQEEDNTDILAWIEDWFSFHCDGDWEHQYGFTIKTIESGGWSLQIDLIETLLEDTEIAWQLVKKSENDWYGLAIKDSVFSASGDLRKLSFLLHSFKELVEAADEDFEE